MRAEVGVRRAIAIATLAGLLAAGCGRPVEGPSVSEYEKKRAELAARSRDGGQKTARVAQVQQPHAAADAGPAEAGFGVVDASYGYDPAGKRDPFRSYILEQAALSKAEPRGPLEQFELGQLELAAVIWGIHKPRALVRDPSGRGYIVAAGTPIGKNSGTVIQIDESKVIVEEVYESPLGERTTKNIEMRIRHSQGG